MDSKKILICSLSGLAILVVLIIIVIVIIKLVKKESFVPLRGGFGNGLLRTNMLSNAYSGKSVYNPNPDSLNSIVSKSSMANAGSIDLLTKNAMAKSNQNVVETVNEKIATSDSNLGQLMPEAAKEATTQTLLDDPTGPQFVQSNQIVKGDSEIVEEAVKEGFFNTGMQNVSVNAMGNLEGPTIYTDGALAHGRKWDEIVEAVKAGKHISDGSTAGAGRGDEFEGIWDKYKKIQDAHDMNPTGVRSTEEIDEITKSLNGDSNLATHNLLTRAGAGKGKVILDPNGTVGVMEDNAKLVPERVRDRNIYATSTVIKIPAYSMDCVDFYHNMTNGGAGHATALSDTTDERVVGFGRNAATTSTIMPTKAEESFSVSD